MSRRLRGPTTCPISNTDSTAKAAVEEKNNARRGKARTYEDPVIAVRYFSSFSVRSPKPSPYSDVDF